MAKPEQTEKPTPKRKREARQRGQVPRSPDIGAAAIFLVMVIVLHVGFLATMDAAARAMTVSLSNAATAGPYTYRSIAGLFAHAFLPFSTLIAMAFCAAIAVAIVVNLLQFGFLFAPGLLAPNFGKLNPFSGIKRLLVSKQTLMNLAKQLVKLTIVFTLVWMSVRNNFTMFYALGHAAPRDIVLAAEGLLFGIGIRFAIFLMIIGIIDYVWERRQLLDSLKMTKQEVKDEAKQSEGNPEAKQALRQRQRAMARRRMMAAVPKATVVVTNPTHYAVALEWDEITMDAPILTAKGADLLAKRIRELAAEHGVPVMENPTLARTLYAKVELDSPVPPDLYAAVAQVIAFVYRLKNRTIA